MINDVVIAGAGPNGLMLACELALAGVQPVVLEKLPEITAEPRANGLVGQVVRMLDRRGLYERITGRAEAPEPVADYMFAAMPLDLTVLADNPLYILPVPQARLTEMLATRAAELGVAVRRGHELTDFTQDDAAVTATVTGPDGPYLLQARYLAGADGGHSVVRKRAGIAFPGVTRDSTVSRTVTAAPPAGWIDPATGALNVPGFGPVPALRHLRTETGGFVYAPFPGRPPVISTTEYGLPDDTAPPLTLAEMEQSIRRVLGADVPLTLPPGDAPPLLRRLVGTSTRIAERFRDRRILLAGDAAHVHSASGGPGLNLGLQDTVNLGWKLAAVVRDPARDWLLDSYEAERRPAGQRVIMQTQAQSALTAPGADVTALRELFGELLTEASVARRIAATLAGSDVRYDVGGGGGGSGGGGDGSGHPLAGRFAPDLDLVTADGPVRLAELTRDARPLLVDLTESGLPSDVGPAGGRLKVVRAKGASDGVTGLLLRPDTYVAWASSSARPGAGEIGDLRQAAARWLG